MIHYRELIDLIDQEAASVSSCIRDWARDDENRITWRRPQCDQTSTVVARYTLRYIINARRRHATDRPMTSDVAQQQRPRNSGADVTDADAVDARCPLRTGRIESRVRSFNRLKTENDWMPWRAAERYQWWTGVRPHAGDRRAEPRREVVAQDHTRRRPRTAGSATLAMKCAPLLSPGEGHVATSTSWSTRRRERSRNVEYSRTVRAHFGRTTGARVMHIS